MKPILYDGILIHPDITKPWTLAVQSGSSNILYGLSFIGVRPIGCACSESFEKVPLDKMAENAYYIDTTPVPYDRVEMLKEYGPIVDTKLPELTITYLGIDRKFTDLISAINFKGTLDRFTCCSVDIIVQVWKVLGARIGRVKSGKIAWDKQFSYPETIKPN